MMSRWIATALLLLLVFGPIPLAAQESKQAQVANAADLIRDGQRAVAQVVKLARVDSRLHPDSARAKPFWEAMKVLNESLDKADTGLTLKDETFFPSIAMAGAAVQQAEIALEMNEGYDANIASTMSVLSRIVSTLNEKYTKEALSLARGGDLTEAERRQLDKLKAQQGGLEEKLGTVEKKAVQGDEKMKRAMRQLRDKSKTIRNARADRSGFVAAMAASNAMAGMLWGWHWWWGPWGYWCPGYIEINIVVWEDWVDAVPYDWTFAEEYYDTADLGLETLDVGDMDIEMTDQLLDSADFSLSEADMHDMTSDLATSWEDVDPGVGSDVMDGMRSNFNEAPFEPQMQLDTFDGVGGFDDFGDF
jgi:hypothetical protein